MNASSLYRRAPHLLGAVLLLFSCLLFTGCRLSSIFAPSLLKDLFGEYIDQFPAVVLNADGQNPVTNYEFNWETTTMAGVSAKTFRPSKNFYRLNVYYSSNGNKIYHNDFQPLANPTTFSSLPTEKLLQVDLEFSDDQQGTQGREIYTFNVLFHND